MLSNLLIGLILCAASGKGHPHPQPQNFFLDPEGSSVDATWMNGGNFIDGGPPIEVALGGSNNLETNPFTGEFSVDGGGGVVALPDDTGLISSENSVLGSGDINFNSPFLVGELPSEQNSEQLFGTLPGFGAQDTPLSQPGIGFNLDESFVSVDGQDTFDVVWKNDKPPNCEKNTGPGYKPYCCLNETPDSCTPWSLTNKHCLEYTRYCCDLNEFDGHYYGTCERYYLDDKEPNPTKFAMI